MKKELFRENAIKKVSSPEQLNEYIRVTNPGIWVTLVAIIVLLIGVCVWGALGRIETTVDAVAISDGSKVLCYMAGSDEISSVEVGQEVKIDENTCTIDSVSADAVQVKDCDALADSERAKYLAGVSNKDWVYEISAKSQDGSVAAGTYNAKIVIESISPMSFILN